MTRCYAVEQVTIQGEIQNVLLTSVTALGSYLQANAEDAATFRVGAGDTDDLAAMWIRETCWD
jgi:uncharacterized protein (DUF736 family)